MILSFVQLLTLTLYLPLCPSQSCLCTLFIPICLSKFDIEVFDPLLSHSERLDDSYALSFLILHLFVGIIYPFLSDIRCLNRLKKKKVMLK